MGIWTIKICLSSVMIRVYENDFFKFLLFFKRQIYAGTQSIYLNLHVVSVANLAFDSRFTLFIFKTCNQEDKNILKV